MKLAGIILLAITLLTPHTALPQRRVQSIRSIDFANFTYPRVGEQRASIGRKTFTVKAGEYLGHEIEDGMFFGDIVYGDVTGDGIEDALVVLGIPTRGSAIANCVYIYTLKHNRPSWLWGFVTGDRADGGLRRIYAEHGKLVIELYGKETRIGGQLYGTETVGACCAKSVTRTRYQWRGNRFRQQGRSEIFSNPAGNSSYVNSN